MHQKDKASPGKKKACWRFCAQENLHLHVLVSHEETKMSGFTGNGGLQLFQLGM
jgi:hypothetical protein